ncbi:MAG: hypothetical protein JXN61_09165 [Sedimentisphaerales bacterium]|nr:hypothetical protein [Sedimentisphaerales bacterium]
MKLFKMQILLTVAVLCAAGTAHANWVTLDYPGATGTWARGIDAGKIVGGYGSSGFLYDGGTWTTVAVPPDRTELVAIDGGSILGISTWIPGGGAIGVGRRYFLVEGGFTPPPTYPPQTVPKSEVSAVTTLSALTGTIQVTAFSMMALL